MSVSWAGLEHSNMLVKCVNHIIHFTHSEGVRNGILIDRSACPSICVRSFVSVHPCTSPCVHPSASAPSRLSLRTRSSRPCLPLRPLVCISVVNMYLLLLVGESQLTTMSKLKVISEGTRIPDKHSMVCRYTQRIPVSTLIDSNV